MAAIDRVFSEDVLARIRARQPVLSGTQLLAYETLTAHGPPPTEPNRAWRLKCRRAWRAAWEAYLDAADACCLLDDEMLGNLRGFEEDQLRGALGEARACWYFAGVRGYTVRPRPPGRNGKVLDMAVDASGTDLQVEVKSPFIGDASDEYRTKALLVAKLEEANKKFEVGRCNVLVLTANLSCPLYSKRTTMLEAFIGQPIYVIPVALEDRTSVPAPYPSFKVDGRLARRPVQEGNFGSPQYKRVSAVVSIEERRDDRSSEILDLNADIEIKPEVLVLHNPHATVPMPEGLLGRVPELVRRGEQMFWSDKVAVEDL
jgi:hypothetical protein